MNKHYEPAQMELFELDALDVIATSTDTDMIPKSNNPNQLEWIEVIR